MTDQTKRHLILSCTLAALVAMVGCTHDAVAPDTAVAVETPPIAQVVVTQEPGTGDGLVTYVVHVRSRETLSSFQGSLAFDPTAFTLVGNTVPVADGAAYMVNANGFGQGEVRFAAFTTTTFAHSDDIEAFRFSVRPNHAAEITSALDVIGTELGVALRSTRAGWTSSPLRLAHAGSCSISLWGDANADDAVSVPDAQQIARVTAGLSVADPSAVAGRGDVNADGDVNIIDAQQIARYSVGLSASARVNTSMPLTVSSLWVSPGAPSVSVGGTVQIVAVPRDVNFQNLTGCVAVTYSSDNTSVATVDANGLISGVHAGSAMITVSAGAQSLDITVTVH